MHCLIMKKVWMSIEFDLNQLTFTMPCDRLIKFKASKIQLPMIIGWGRWQVNYNLDVKTVIKQLCISSNVISFCVLNPINPNKNHIRRLPLQLPFP